MKNYHLVFRDIDRDKFLEIANGRKTIETRAATTKYQSIKTGDTLTFVCGNDNITKTVNKVEYFDNLNDMLSVLPLAQILPSVNNIEEAKKMYFGFPGYKEKIDNNGLLAFSLDS